MAILGLISDTHGLLRSEAVSALAGVDAILHAGDVGTRAILERLREIAPVTAVEGNVDPPGWLPAQVSLEVEGVSIQMAHDLEPMSLRLDPKRAAVLICGHSHVPGERWIKGVHVVNPGSAGPRRFNLPISVARMTVTSGAVSVEWITLE